MSSLQAYVDDLLQSKAAIQANTPFTCNTFIQPGVWTGDAYFDSYAKMDNMLGQAIQNNFRQSQLYLLGRMCGVGSPVWQHGTESNFGIDYQNQPVTSDFLQTMDYISQIPGAVYLITFHGIQSSTGSMTYNTRADLMAALLTKLADLRGAGLIRIASMNDAFNNNQFSPDINRVFDSGFELYDAKLNKYTVVWTLTGGDTIADAIGYNGSRCGRVVSGGLLRALCYLPSGRYKLSWKQKPDTGTTLNNNGINLWVGPINDNDGTGCVTVAFPTYRNTTNDWEEKSVILKIPDNCNRVYTRFYTSGSSPFLVDDVSMRQLSTDASECVSNFKATPSPGSVQFTWRAPDDTAYKNVYLKYSLTQKSPQTIGEGTLLQVVAANNGNAQSISCPFNWVGKSQVFFSAFAVQQDNNTYSEPDVDFVQVDQTKPVVGNLKLALDGSQNVVATWQVVANASHLYTTTYSVGSRQAVPDIVGWTVDDNGSALLGRLNPSYYVNVQAENIFGVLSDIVYAPISNTTQNPQVLYDGTAVNVTGAVSAIFNGCYYIQLPNNCRGIKVVGPTTSLSLGMSVTVQGILRTSAGERYIDTNPAP